jgi:hypothetical protein
MTKPPLATCYLCDRLLRDGTPINMDHVPPQRFFPKSVRKALALQLDTLPTHVACNSAYKQDEEYLVLALAAYAHDSEFGRALMKDLRAGLQKGHGVGLYKAIKKGFGSVTAPDGSILFQYDKNRIDRVIWKIVRGLYRLHTGRSLPIDQPFECSVVPPTEAQERLPKHEWFLLLMGTTSLCEYGAVFDMKALGGIDGVIRAHFQTFLFWDRIVALVRFHDPTCGCDECRLRPT